MTEDEAKTTQCCGPEGCGYVNTEPRPARWCVGSACMAWRTSDRKLFRHEELEQQTKPDGDGWYAINPRAAQLLWMRDVPLGEFGGFCGLAGAPQ